MPADAEGLRPPSLSQQAGWLLLAKVIGFVLAFIAPLLIVRVLDQREFGLYKQAFIIVANATPLLTLGFYMNAFYFLPRRRQEGPKVVLNVLIVHLAAGLLALTVLLVWPGVLTALLGNSDLVSYSPLLGVLLCSWIFGFFLEVVATAGQDVKYSTAFIVLSQLTRSITMCGAAVVFGTLEALLYAAIVQGIVQSATLLWYVQRRYPGFLSKPDWHLMREQLGYAVPLGIAGIAAMVGTDAHLYFVAHRFSAAEYAIYAVGCFQVPLLALLRESINAVLIPRISFLQQQDDRREIIRLLSRTMRKLAFVYWPVTVFLGVMAGDFIKLLYTSRYAGSVPVFVINVMAIPTLILISDPVTRAYTEHMGYLVKARIAAAVLILPAVHFGIQYFGMQGAITASVAVIATERLVVMGKVTRILGVTRSDLRLFSDVLKLAVAAGVAGLAAAGVRHLADNTGPAVTLAAAAVVFSATYLAAVVAMRIPTSEESGLVRGKVVHVGRMLRLA